MQILNNLNIYSKYGLLLLRLKNYYLVYVKFTSKYQGRALAGHCRHGNNAVTVSCFAGSMLGGSGEDGYGRERPMPDGGTACSPCSILLPCII